MRATSPKRATSPTRPPPYDNTGQVFRPYMMGTSTAMASTLPIAKLCKPCPGIPINIVYEDNDLLVINKQAGLVVHPTTYHYDDTLLNALAHWYRGTNVQCFMPHRIDRDTTGLIVLAKTLPAHEFLQAAFQRKEYPVEKYYIAYCLGVPDVDHGTIETPIRGQHATTVYGVLDRWVYKGQHYSKIMCRIFTGRMHQIRIHLRSIDCPILGDAHYGVKTPLINRQALHSFRCAIQHPITRKPMVFLAPVPDDIKDVEAVFSSVFFTQK